MKKLLSSISKIFNRNKDLSHYGKEPEITLEKTSTEENKVLNPDNNNSESKTGEDYLTVSENEILPTRKGDFRLNKFIEEGVCQVFKGTPVSVKDKRKLDKCILVKRVHPEWHNNKEVLEQFKREIGIIRDFIHPLLPHFVDKGELAGQYYYAYEFIEGEPLINIFNDKKNFPREKLIELAPLVLMQLLDQLKYLHEQMFTIVHGDISVENIIYSNQNSVHLIDFGCAYRKQKVTEKSYHWLGKPSYITPEQARGEPWSKTSDLYQAGILFYELVSGLRWNKGNTPAEKVLFAASVDSPDKNFLSHWVPSPLSELVSKMLQAEESQRISSAKECQELLAPYV